MVVGGGATASGEGPGIVVMRYDAPSFGLSVSFVERADVPKVAANMSVWQHGRK